MGRLYRFMLALVLLSTVGCAGMVYRDKDGNRVMYGRFLATTDSIKGTVPGASVEVTGQNFNLDAIRVVTESAIKAAATAATVVK